VRTAVGDRPITDREASLVVVLDDALQRIRELEAELVGIHHYAQRARRAASDEEACRSLRVIALHCQEVLGEVTPDAAEEEEGHAHPDGPGR
jgi:hypothetical protein